MTYYNLERKEWLPAIFYILITNKYCMHVVWWPCNIFFGTSHSQRYGPLGAGVDQGPVGEDIRGT